MDLRFRCTWADFVPQVPCAVRLITAEEWRENGQRWGIYADWGPQREDIEKMEAKGEVLFVLFEGEHALACAGRLPRSAQEDEVDAVWVRVDRRGQGLGRRLVAFVAAAILREGKTALYSAHEDNIPSQRVAEAVGFKRITSADG